MSFILEFLPEAFAEVECVTGDYEARSAGLGARFRAEVESACTAIVQHALIVAIAHASRHPNYFERRMP